MSGSAGSASSRPLGRIDGRYTIVSRLGKGSMGVVYRARDEQIDREVAVKVMMADTESDDVAVERFHREARAMGRLLHRNVVTVYNMGEASGRHYIVMELLEGCTLSEWMKDGSHSLEDHVDLMLQTCDGLSVAHSAGIVHRDVKPNNLFVQVDGTLKIVDFGIARLASSNMTRSGLVLGTPHYMSPEQARGAEIDERSDVFSAAAVFYHMVAGRRPFDGTDLPIVLHRVVNDDPAPLTEHEAPPALARIIAKGLRKPLDQRYQSVAAMAADLARFKRQYEGETRRLVASTDQRFAQLRRTAVEIAALRTTLGLAATSPLDAAISDVETLFPVPQASSGRMRAMAEHRFAAEAIHAAVDDASRVADEEQARLSILQKALLAAEHALVADDPHRALESLRGAVSKLQGEACPPLQALVTRAQTLLTEQLARADYVKTLIDRGREAEASGQWSVALQRANDALSLAPQSSDALALLQRANQALAEAAAAKVQRTRRLYDQAEAALAAARFDQVDQIIGLVTEVDPADAGLPGLLARLAAARDAEARRSAEVRATAEVLASTRASFAAGQHDQAIAALEAFMRRYPHVSPAAEQLRRFRAEVAQIAALEARATEAHVLVDQAEAAWRQGDIEGCDQLASKALALAPDLEPALQMREKVRARRIELEQGRARREQAATLARAAVDAMARGSFDHAVSEARRALELDPERGDAAVVVADVPRLVLDARRDAEQRRLEAERARVVDQLMQDARSRLSGGDYHGAVAAAERASQMDAGRAGVATVLAQSRAVLAAVRAGGWEAGIAESAPVPAVADKRSSGVRRLAEGAREWFSPTRRSKP